MEINRNAKLDQLKFFLIVLVVFAHIPLLEGFLSNGVEPLEVSRDMKFAIKVVYAFHMPLFVFLSGYFTKRRSLKETIRKSLPVLYTFVLFHVVDILIISINANSLPSLNRIITPCFALWYLLALLLWRVIISVINDDGKEKIFLVLILVISLVVGFVPIQTQLGFQRLFSFFPFFYCGYLMKKFKKDILSFPSWINWSLAIILFSICTIIAGLKSCWLEPFVFSYHSEFSIIDRFLSVLLSGVMMLCILFFVSKMLPNKWMCNWGSNTLFVYIYHPYVLYLVSTIWYNHLGKINVLAGLSITIITISFLVLLSKLNIFQFLVRWK